MKKKVLLIYLAMNFFVFGIPVGVIKGGEKYIAKVGVDGLQRIELSGGSYYFKPDHIVIKKGVPVQIKAIRETLIVPHNIIIENILDGKDISETMTREGKVINFIPSKEGTYDFYCDKKLLFLKSHRDHGMKGVIEVVE